MGAERSSEKTITIAEPPVDERVIKCDESLVFARGLVARGYQASAIDGGVSTDAPDSVFKAMADAYRSR